MPIISFGTYPMANTRQTLDVIMDAIEVGYRAFDTAFQYDNELVIGLSLNNMMALTNITRQDLWVTTKVWNTFHSKELVAKQTKMSLKNLGLDYIDLLLMHYPTGYAHNESDHKLWFPRYANGTTVPMSWTKHHYLDTWKGMEDMVRQGLVKSIGISNFNAQQMDKLLAAAQIKPVINQVEINAFYSNQKLVNHCKKIGVLAGAYAPLHPNIDKEPVIDKISQKYHKTNSQVAIRWLLQQGIHVTVKSSRKKFMAQNVDVFDFNLTHTDMQDIFKLPTLAKKIDDPGSHTHPDYPFKELTDELVTVASCDH